MVGRTPLRSGRYWRLRGRGTPCEVVPKCASSNRRALSGGSFRTAWEMSRSPKRPTSFSFHDLADGGGRLDAEENDELVRLVGCDLDRLCVSASREPLLLLALEPPMLLVFHVGEQVDPVFTSPCFPKWWFFPASFVVGRLETRSRQKAWNPSTSSSDRIAATARGGETGGGKE